MSSSKSSYHKSECDDRESSYRCPNCLRIELSSYEGWLWHIGSREHQISNVKNPRAFFNPSGRQRPEILRRCVDVHGILGLKARQLLEYFKTYGEIEDFSYWYKNEGEDGLAVRCVCLYKERESADACVEEKLHELDGKKLKVEPYKTYAHYGVGEGEQWSKGGESRKRKSYGNSGDYYEGRNYKSSRH